jgi:hypothetical protein
MLPSTMLNLFRWALTPQCTEIILETVVINILSVLYSSNHGLRKTLGKMEWKNLPVSATSQRVLDIIDLLFFQVFFDIHFLDHGSAIHDDFDSFLYRMTLLLSRLCVFFSLN